MTILDESVLGAVGGPPALAVDCDLKSLGAACARWAYRDGLTVRWLRGDRMRDIAGVYSEFAAALQFPWYFGRNSAAMDECLSDLDWIEFSGIVVVIFDAGQVLVDDDNDVSHVLGWLSYAYREFSAPIELGEWWDRPAKPFHVVLQMSEEESHRWLIGFEKVRARISMQWSEPETSLGWLRVSAA